MYDFHSYLISFLKHLLIGIYLYTFLQVHSKFPDSIRENRVCCSCHYSCCCSDCSYFQWTWQEHQLRDHCLITADTDTCLFLKRKATKQKGFILIQTKYPFFTAFSFAIRWFNEKTFYLHDYLTIISSVEVSLFFDTYSF